MSREDFLESLERDPHFHPCRCKEVGYSLDPETRQWVCGECRKPSGGNPRYSPYCLGCGDRYTITRDHTDKDLCPNCK